MSKRTISANEQIKSLCNRINADTQRWIDINDNGCWDPSWPDGTNMNLVRRHIIWNKTSILEICIKNGVRPKLYIHFWDALLFRHPMLRILSTYLTRIFFVAEPILTT